MGKSFKGQPCGHETILGTQGRGGLAFTRNIQEEKQNSPPSRKEPVVKRNKVDADPYRPRSKRERRVILLRRMPRAHSGQGTVR